MTKRIAFHVHNLNNLKVYGPVIDHLLKDHESSWEPVIIFNLSTDAQPSLPLDEEVLSDWGKRVQSLKTEGGSGLSTLVKAADLDVIVNITTRMPGMGRNEVQEVVRACRRSGTRLVSLPHLHDTEVDVINDPLRATEDWDLICLMSDHSVGFLETQLKAESSGFLNGLLEKCRITGYPEFDGLARLNNEEVRAKYKLPPDKPIVLLSTAFDYSTSYWVRALLARFKGESVLGPKRLYGRLGALIRCPHLLSYRRYLESLSKFTARNGAYLVGKTRAKHKDPDFVSDYVDTLAGDLTFYPFTTLELLSVSQAYFGFFSYTAFEAVVCGSRATTFVPLPWKLYVGRQYHRWLEYFALREGGVWNWSGVSRLIDGTKRSSGKELKLLAESGLEDYEVDRGAREAYLDRYVAHLGQSSAQVMTAISNLF